MININRTVEAPKSLQEPSIQVYLKEMAECSDDTSKVKPKQPVSFRNSDVLAAFDHCFYSKCWLTEQKFGSSWEMDIDHFFPQNERPLLVLEWTNLYPAAHKANMIRPRKTPVGGYLDPCSPNEDVELEIIYSLALQGNAPRFGAAVASSQKAINTAKLLDLVHNGKQLDNDSVENTKHLRLLIKERFDDVMETLVEWLAAQRKGHLQNEFEAAERLKILLSRKSSFTMLMRSINAVRAHVPTDFLD
jgi:hypothetical protein